MTEEQARAYDAWQRAANPSEATLRKRTNYTDDIKAQRRIVKLRDKYLASLVTKDN